MPRIAPNLWFDTESLEAAEYYCSIFPNSEIKLVSHYTEAGGERAGTVLTVDFLLDGQQITAINGGPQFTFDEAISLLIYCKDQAEIDYYWDKLSEGGEEGQCGWLKDKFGLALPSEGRTRPQAPVSAIRTARATRRRGFGRAACARRSR